MDLGDPSVLNSLRISENANADASRKTFSVFTSHRLVTIFSFSCMACCTLTLLNSRDAQASAELPRAL